MSDMFEGYPKPIDAVPSNFPKFRWNAPLMIRVGQTNYHSVTVYLNIPQDVQNIEIVYTLGLDPVITLNQNIADFKISPFNTRTGSCILSWTLFPAATAIFAQTFLDCTFQMTFFLKDGSILKSSNYPVILKNDLNAQSELPSNNGPINVDGGEILRSVLTETVELKELSEKNAQDIADIDTSVAEMKVNINDLGDQVDTLDTLTTGLADDLDILEEHVAGLTDDVQQIQTDMFKVYVTEQDISNISSSAWSEIHSKDRAIIKCADKFYLMSKKAENSMWFSRTDHDKIYIDQIARSTDSSSWEVAEDEYLIEQRLFEQRFRIKSFGQTPEGYNIGLSFIVSILTAEPFSKQPYDYNDILNYIIGYADPYGSFNDLQIIRASWWYTANPDYIYQILNCYTNVIYDPNPSYSIKASLLKDDHSHFDVEIDNVDVVENLGSRLIF